MTTTDKTTAQLAMPLFDEGKPRPIRIPFFDRTDYPKTISRDQFEEGVSYLMNMGAKFVLCRENKSPAWKSWQRRSPRISDVINHYGPIAVIPSTLGLTALDADHIPNVASLDQMLQRCPHVAMIGSLKADRGHIWVVDDKPRTNGRFEAFGVTGDIRSASGYIILWGDAPYLLARHLINHRLKHGGELGPSQMQEWLIESGAVEKVVTQPAAKTKRKSSAKKRKTPRQHFRLVGPNLPTPEEVAKVKVGERNTNLFNWTRHWAYSQWGKTGRKLVESGEASFEDWLGRVQDCAHTINRAMTDPLPTDEVNSTARSIAEFCLNLEDNPNRTWRRRTSEEQREHAINSGIARRKRSGHLATDPTPWLTYGISQRHYYRKREEFLNKNPGHLGELPPEIFRRQTPEEALEQRRQASAAAAAKRKAIREQQAAQSAAGNVPAVNAPTITSPAGKAPVAKSQKKKKGAQQPDSADADRPSKCRGQGGWGLAGAAQPRLPGAGGPTLAAAPSAGAGNGDPLLQPPLHRRSDGTSHQFPQYPADTASSSTAGHQYPGRVTVQQVRQSPQVSTSAMNLQGGDSSAEHQVGHSSGQQVVSGLAVIPPTITLSERHIAPLNGHPLPQDQYPSQQPSSSLCDVTGPSCAPDGDAILKRQADGSSQVPQQGDGSSYQQSANGSPMVQPRVSPQAGGSPQVPPQAVRSSDQLQPSGPMTTEPTTALSEHHTAPLQANPIPQDQYPQQLLFSSLSDATGASCDPRHPANTQPQTVDRFQPSAVVLQISSSPTRPATRNNPVGERWQHANDNCYCHLLGLRACPVHQARVTPPQLPQPASDPISSPLEQHQPVATKPVGIKPRKTPVLSVSPLLCATITLIHLGRERLAHYIDHVQWDFTFIPFGQRSLFDAPPVTSRAWSQPA